MTRTSATRTANGPETRRPATAVPHRRLTAVLLVAGAVAVNGAFLALGAAFDYPAVLNKEPGEVLATFHANQLAIGGWFVLLAGRARHRRAASRPSGRPRPTTAA